MKKKINCSRFQTILEEIKRNGNEFISIFWELLEFLMRILKTLFLTFCISVFSYESLAGISLSQAIVHFEKDGKLSEDIEIYNQGNETVYIRVEPSIIENPGLENESRKNYRDPRKAGLLVTPQRLIIPAGTRKILRLVKLDNIDKSRKSSEQKDKVYRVLVKPEVGEVSAEQTAVKIIVAYEVLVLAQPPEPKINLQHEFEGNTLRLSNTGNTNLLLQKGIQCPPGQSQETPENSCVELAGKRLYANAKWQVEVPFDTPVTYQYSVGMENDVVVFNPNKNKKQKK